MAALQSVPLGENFIAGSEPFKWLLQLNALQQLRTSTHFEVENKHSEPLFTIRAIELLIQSSLSNTGSWT